MPTKNRERPALPIVVHKVPKNWFSKFHGEMDIRQVHQGFYSFLDKILITFVLFSKWNASILWKIPKFQIFDFGHLLCLPLKDWVRWDGKNWGTIWWSSLVLWIRVGATTPRELTFSQKCTAYFNHDDIIIEMKIPSQHLHRVWPFHKNVLLILCNHKQVSKRRFAVHEIIILTFLSLAQYSIKTSTTIKKSEFHSHHRPPSDDLM